MFGCSPGFFPFVYLSIRIALQFRCVFLCRIMLICCSFVGSSAAPSRVTVTLVIRARFMYVCMYVCMVHKT
jgi:hypothetical protein